MKREKHILVYLLITALMLTGCTDASLPGTVTEPSSVQTAAPTADAGTQQDSQITQSDIDISVTDRDRDDSYVESTATKIVFEEDKILIDGAGASASDTTVTIMQEGTYVLRGASSNGQIIVEADKTKKIQLVLDGLSLQNQSGPALLIAQADKVWITLAPQSENLLSDAQEYQAVLGETTLDAALFSKEDLTINGTGSLRVTGQYKHGIVSKDDLVITGGNITVKSAYTGIEGKDAVIIADGQVTVDAGTDAIRSTNTEDALRGFVAVSGGILLIQAGTDGIQAQSLVQLDGGEIEIQSGSGSENASSKPDSQWGKWGPVQQTSTEDTASAKGIKSAARVVINDTRLTVDSSDDAIHANGTVQINGGMISVLSGDDGIHADQTLEITGGTIAVEKSYEGLEAGEINISGGEIFVTASDDGLNAAGGSDQSALGGRIGQNPFAADAGKRIAISGGVLVVDAAGDGIDSNGDLQISGGITLVSGPVDGANGALDYGSSATITGGILMAAGSSAMAQSVSQTSSQGSLMVDIEAQQAGTPLALCDDTGAVLVSFSPMKAYENVLISVPEIQSGNTYTLCTGTILGADAYGFAQNTAISDTVVLASIEMDTNHYQQTGSRGGFDAMREPGMNGPWKDSSGQQRQQAEPPKDSLPVQP